MGLPFGKKKPQDTGEKKDLKQNYTTEDHKTDLGDLLKSFNSDATQVGTALEGARRGGGAVEGHRQSGVAWLCLGIEKGAVVQSGCCWRWCCCCLVVVLQFSSTSAKLGRV